MSWDIYGERLERGHCEVHPWVGEEYPCSLCYAKYEGQQQSLQLQKDMEREWNDAIEAEHRHLMYMEYSQEYKTLHEREEKIKRLLVLIAERKREVVEKIPF